MTREQALELIPLPRWYGDDAQRGWLLDSLIALGVLQIDSMEITVPLCESFAAIGIDISEEQLRTFEKALFERGLNVTRRRTLP